MYPGKTWLISFRRKWWTVRSGLWSLSVDRAAFVWVSFDCEEDGEGVPRSFLSISNRCSLTHSSWFRSMRAYAVPSFPRRSFVNNLCRLRISHWNASIASSVMCCLPILCPSQLLSSSDDDEDSEDDTEDKELLSWSFISISWVASRWLLVCWRFVDSCGLSSSQPLFFLPLLLATPLVSETVNPINSFEDCMARVHRLTAWSASSHG